MLGGGADYQDARREALPPGTVLRDYTLGATLGHGGFGIVYGARHNQLGYDVAIKEYLPGMMADRVGKTVCVKSARYEDDFDTGMRRFLSEAKSLVALQDCPGVVRCRDFFPDNGTAYLVMDYVDALPLSKLLREREAEGRPFGEEELLAVVMPLLQGLVQVHSAGVWHRDIKPSNILIRRDDEQPVLIDFGAAKQVIADVSRSMAPYTEGYAAPEQAGGQGLGPWTDIYGVGAVMWRVVAGGKPPWNPPNPVRAEQRTFAEVTGKADPLPSASSLGAGRFSPKLLAAADRCLRLKVGNRIQDCNELLWLLRKEGSLAEESSKQPDSKLGEESSAGPRSLRGRLRELVPVAALAVLLLAVVGLGTWSRSPKRPQVRPFSVDVVPSDATVQFSNSDRSYSSGMDLEPGRYQVSVSAEGYEPRIEWVEHDETGVVRQIELQALERPPETDDERELEEYVAKLMGVVGGESHRRRAIERLEELQRARLDSELEQSRRQEAHREERRLKEEERLQEEEEQLAQEELRKKRVREASKAEWNDVAFTDGEGKLRGFIEKWQDEASADDVVAKAKEWLAEMQKSEAQQWSNSSGMEFVLVPVGQFWMGSTGEQVPLGEGPVTQVRISEAFYLGKFEVTQEEWVAVMGSNPSFFKNCGWDCPVEQVSWNDVQEFVVSLNAIDPDERYRLPSEAEWEYAARAGTTTDTPAGDLNVEGARNAPILDGLAWYSGNSGVGYEVGYDCSTWEEKQYVSSRCGPHPVGGKASNRFSLHDMLGNVFEWVHDWDALYLGGEVSDPRGPSEGSRRIYRGGSWSALARSCRSANRDESSPDRRNADLGFRLLREVPKR